MPLPSSVIIDGREYIPKMPAANVAWTLGEYLSALREARGQPLEHVARECRLSAAWLALVEQDESVRLPFPLIVRLTRYYHADLELMALCYDTTRMLEPPLEPGDETEISPDETDDTHDNESAVVSDYLALSHTGEPDDEQ